ncbi:hypothetical protein [Flavobacterium selenitireducens]|uniref:hypothetical protein n=1 Tax=Flavobacterium selenitireducens TaxID=2722704 RepID=UPI00168B417C|nr:hypothetical protein [Flavobacterium selenitireducens]MBD3583090.1 hypothetical protein [Flavobacterium selenitireducens]
MKSIITFSLALLAAFAGNAATYQGLSEMDTETVFGGGVPFHTKFVNEEFVAHPSTFISSNYAKTAEETASDSKQIIEAIEEEALPLYFETSIAEINESNALIEAKLPAYAPLDFNYINKGQKKLSLPSALPKL